MTYTNLTHTNSIENFNIYINDIKLSVIKNLTNALHYPYQNVIKFETYSGI